MLSKLHGNTRS